jgi:hypothetical protein
MMNTKVSLCGIRRRETEREEKAELQQQTLDFHRQARK